MATEIYNPVRSLQISGHTHEEIQGEPVTPKGAPFLRGHIPTFSTVVVSESSINGTEVDYFRLYQVTPHHNRSFEVRFDLHPPKKRRKRAYEVEHGGSYSFFWQDEYGNYFSGLTTKGNLLTQPQVARSGQEPSGFAVFGMQDSSALVRILRASRILRANNIDTECFIKIIESQELPYKGKMLPIEEFKAGLVQQIWDSPRHGRNWTNFGQPVNRDDVPSYSKHLAESMFVITVRGMQTPERLQDLAVPKAHDKDGFRQIMAKVLNYINLEEEFKAKKTGNTPECFDVDKDEDAQRYLLSYLPKRMGTNYGKLHHLGLLHVFGHPGNISAIGGIYDLDSVRGERTECGDAPVTDKELEQEKENILENLTNVLTEVGGKGFLGMPTNENWLEQVETNFNLAYSEAKHGLLPQLRKLIERYHYFDREESPNLFNEYVSKLVEELGWDYQHQEPMKDLIERFNQQDRQILEERAEVALTEPSFSADGPQGILDEYFESTYDENMIFAYRPDGVDRFLAFCHREIEDAIYKEHKKEFDGIEQRFGREAIKGTLWMLAEKERLRYEQSILQDVAVEIEERSQKSIQEVKDYYLKNLRRFYLDFIKDPPEDFYPILPVELIWESFEGFANPTSEELKMLGKYLNLVVQQEVKEEGGGNHTDKALEQLSTLLSKKKPEVSQRFQVNGLNYYDVKQAEMLIRKVYDKELGILEANCSDSYQIVIGMMTMYAIHTLTVPTNAATNGHINSNGNGKGEPVNYQIMPKVEVVQIEQAEIQTI